MCFDRNEKIKQILLNLLDDTDVIAKIKHIFSAKSMENSNFAHSIAVDKVPHQGEIQKYITENNTLKNKITELQFEIRRSETIIDSTKNSLENAKKDLLEGNKKIKEIQDECNRLSREKTALDKEKQTLFLELSNIKHDFSSFREIYEVYKNLSPAVRQSLSGIFKGNDIWTFVICGVQPDNLWSFWDFCKTELNQGRVNDQEKLVQILTFFLDTINRCVYETPRYLLQPVKIGDNFSTDEFMATSQSSAVGKISKILLPGIIYANNRKIARKSLVEVGR